MCRFRHPQYAPAEDVSEVLVCYALRVYESPSTLQPNRAAVPGEPLSDVISIRYILGFRKDNAKFFSKLSLNR